MPNTVSLSGPIGSSMTLQFGSTGRYTATVTDPQYPTGGYSGPLEADHLRNSVTSFQEGIDSSNKLIKMWQDDILRTQLSSNYSPEDKQLIIADYERRIAQEENRKNNFARSITIAQYLLANVTSLRARLDAAQASATPNTTQPNAPNQQPATIAANTAPTTTASGSSGPPPIDSSLEGSPQFQEQNATPVTKPATTTNPSNHLPLGDEIDDIYDPNLTPEQIASLSPGDRRARENFFIEEAGGTPNTEGLGQVEADGTIVVTAPRDEEVTTIATQQDQVAFPGKNDWRVRLSLSPAANYLYRSGSPGILTPLQDTDGVLFPYTPTVSVNYAANYEASNIIHSNYKVYQYSNSSVDQITITCDFTAQDDAEANYLLAVIHFFRSMTKMFYGKDQNPRAGTPPPLCYMFGMGNFQFSAHPLAITNFTYNLPNDVDYIKTISPYFAGEQQTPATVNDSVSRLQGTGADPGGEYPAPDFSNTETPIEENLVTWVPTKIQLSITCIPIMSRNQVSNKFSLEEYASGSLLNGIDKQGGGFW